MRIIKRIPFFLLIFFLSLILFSPNITFADSTLSGNFEIKRSGNTINFVDIGVNSNLANYTKSIEIIIPKSIELSSTDNFSLPTGWTFFQNETRDDGNFNSYTFSSNDKQATVIQITDLLKSLSFNIGSGTNPEGKDIKVLFHNKILTSRIDENGTTHYYSYIPYSTLGVNEMTWVEAYNYAKSVRYRGLEGYLTTITSKEEQNFIYSNIAKSSGWLGGTRALDVSSKISDQVKLNNSSINIDSSSANKWYWACGPEATQIFFDNTVYSSIFDYSLPGAFNWFSNPSNNLSGDFNEPNNYGGVEAYLQFAHSGDHWNDLSNNSSLPNGIYIEYSQYGSQVENQSDETDYTIVKTVPDNTIFKVEREGSLAKLVNLNIYETLANYSKSIELIIPSGFKISNPEDISLPSGWTFYKNETGNSKESFTFSSNGISASSSSLNTMIESILFDVNQEVLSDNQEVKLLFHNRILTSRVDEEGVHHYYSYIPYVDLGLTKMTWKDAYNYAKTLKYKNLKGYLATITTNEEQNFIYDNIAKNPGWLGGTRAVINNEKINDQSAIDSALDINTNVANKWYWANGPESGIVFFNNTTFSSQVDYSVPGIYNNFSNVRNGTSSNLVEPNNYNNTEAFLQFAFVNAGRFWNDLAESTTLLNGVYVEYSSYGDQIESDSDSTDIIYNAEVPQPVTIQYKDTQGNKLKDDTTFSDSAYLIGSVLLETVPTLDKYKLVKIVDNITGDLSSLPVSAKTKVQNFTMYFEKSKVNMKVNYIDESDGLPIFNDALTDESYKESDTEIVNAGDSITETLTQLIEENKVKLNYTGYDDILIDSYVTDNESGEQEYTTIPNTDFSITYRYKPQTVLYEVPEFINFGTVDPRTLLSKETTLFPKEKIENVKIINTNRATNWVLSASLPEGIRRNSDSQELNGDLFYKNLNNKLIRFTKVPTVLGKQSGSKPYQEFVTSLDNSVNGVGIGINVFEKQKDYLGCYRGQIEWTIDSEDR